MKNLRTIQILDYINEKNICTIQQLMGQFNISHATIHRDISDLEEKGLIRRVRGGVAALTPEEPTIFSRYQDRLNRNSDAKQEVARKALSLVEDGDIIFLDSSTTVYYLSKELQKTNFSNLTIVSNSLLVIQEFSLFPTNYFLVALGGNYDLQLNAFLGQTTMNDLEKLKFDKAFVSSLGITKDGISSRHENHSYFLKRVLEIAAQSYLLLTADKFGKSGLFDIAPPKALAGVVANAPLPDYLN